MLKFWCCAFLIFNGIMVLHSNGKVYVLELFCAFHMFEVHIREEDVCVIISKDKCFLVDLNVQ